MIERASEFGASAAAPLISGDTTHQSAGDMLRQAREAHGLDVAVVAAALKVPVQKIEALEDDDIDALPDPVFARALAASMCRALRIDPRPVLAKLPDVRNPGLHTQPAMPSFRTSSMQRSGGGGLISKSLLLVVGLLLVAAAALFWLPQSALDQVSASVDRIMNKGGASSSAESKAEVEAPMAAVAPGTTVEPAAQAAASAPSQSAGPQLATASTPAAPVAPSAPAPAASSDAAASGQLIVFNVRTESWISVTDAGGKQLLQRTVPAGETVALDGTPPLKVIVGRAAGVDVQVRGKAFDLAPLTRGGTVARFEVKP